MVLLEKIKCDDWQLFRYEGNIETLIFIIPSQIIYDHIDIIQYQHLFIYLFIYIYLFT